MIANRSTLANALRVAAIQYQTDAETCRREPGHERIVEAFEQQSHEAIALADMIEQADTIRLED